MSDLICATGSVNAIGRQVQPVHSRLPTNLERDQVPIPMQLQTNRDVVKLVTSIYEHSHFMEPGSWTRMVVDQLPSLREAITGGAVV